MAAAGQAGVQQHPQKPPSAPASPLPSPAPASRMRHLPGSPPIHTQVAAARNPSAGRTKGLCPRALGLPGRASHPAVNSAHGTLPVAACRWSPQALAVGQPASRPRPPRLPAAVAGPARRFRWEQGCGEASLFGLPPAPRPALGGRRAVAGLRRGAGAAGWGLPACPLPTPAWWPESLKPALGMDGEERKGAGGETCREAGWHGGLPAGGGRNEWWSLRNASLEAQVGILLLINPVFITEQFWGCEKLVPDLIGAQARHRLALKTIASSCN